MTDVLCTLSSICWLCWGAMLAEKQSDKALKPLKHRAAGWNRGTPIVSRPSHRGACKHNVFEVN